MNRTEKKSEMKMARIIDVLAATPARLGLFWPRRLPILRMRCQRMLDVGKDMIYLTDTATPNAKGAWKVEEAETSKTDCAARVTGPSLT